MQKIKTIAITLLTLMTASLVAKDAPLTCHVGGTMRPVMQKLSKDYEKKTGRKIEINSAGSGELLAHIELQKDGDLYVCHDPFLDILMKKNLGVDGWTVAELTPVIAVQKGNPKNIKSLNDLTRPDVEVILTDYQRSSLGRMLKTIFGKAGIDLDELKKKKEIPTNKSGSYAANYVKMKNADATIVWKAVAALRKDSLDIVEITPCLPVPNVDAVTSATGKAYYLTPLRVTIATLSCSDQPKEAAEFAEFLTSPETAKVLKDYGFTMDKKIIRKEYENKQKLK